MGAHITGVSLSPKHGFSKEAQASIRLLAGLGVEGDAHAGVMVKHRYMVRKDPTKANLCQVHLLPQELLDELNGLGFGLSAGAIGENVTTLGVDLIALPTGTLLELGDSAVVEVTGLRSPCVQMNDFRAGLMKACFGVDGLGKKMPRAGIMGIVVEGGEVRVGDGIRVVLPAEPHRALVCV